MTIVQVDTVDQSTTVLFIPNLYIHVVIVISYTLRFVKIKERKAYKMNAKP